MDGCYTKFNREFVFEYSLLRETETITIGVIGMTKISKRQEAIMDFIKSEVEKKGYPPSVA